LNEPILGRVVGGIRRSKIQLRIKRIAKICLRFYVYPFSPGRKENPICRINLILKFSSQILKVIFNNFYRVWGLIPYVGPLSVLAVCFAKVNQTPKSFLD
jgi:hypothetical protein